MGYSRLVIAALLALVAAAGALEPELVAESKLGGEVFGALEAGGAVYTVGSEGLLRELDAGDLRLLRAVRVGRGWSSSVAATERALYVGSDDGAVSVRDRRTLAELARLELGGAVHCVAANHGLLLGATERGEVVAFDEATLSERARLRGLPSFHWAAADDRRIYGVGGRFPCGCAGRGPGGLVAWDRATLEPVARRRLPSFAWTVALDGPRVLVGTNDGWLRALDADGLGQVGAVGLGSPVLSLLVGGRYVFAGLGDGTVAVLERSTLARRASVAASRPVWALSEGGSRLVAGGEDGTLRAWDLAPVAPSRPAARARGGPPAFCPLAPQSPAPAASAQALLAAGPARRPAAAWPWVGGTDGPRALLVG